MKKKSPDDGKTSRILDAARSILAENGYAAATISQIAEKAGVSRGLLHYYFKNKQEMLTQVIRHNMEYILKTTETIFANAQDADQLAEDLSGSLRDVMEKDPNFFRLFLESWTLTRQGPGIAKWLAEMHARFRETICAGLELMEKRQVIGPISNPRGLAALLTGIVDGLGMHLAVDPRLLKDDKVWESVKNAIRVLVNGQGR